MATRCDRRWAVIVAVAFAIWLWTPSAAMSILRGRPQHHRAASSKRTVLQEQPLEEQLKQLSELAGPQLAAQQSEPIFVKDTTGAVVLLTEAAHPDKSALVTNHGYSTGIAHPNESRRRLYSTEASDVSQAVRQQPSKSSGKVKQSALRAWQALAAEATYQSASARQLAEAVGAPGPADEITPILNFGPASDSPLSIPPSGMQPAVGIATSPVPALPAEAVFPGALTFVPAPTGLEEAPILGPGAGPATGTPPNAESA